MKKIFLSLGAVLLTALSAKAEVVSVDFSEFGDGVAAIAGASPIEQNGFYFFGNDSKAALSSTGFYTGGASTAISRYLYFTPSEQGVLSVTARGENFNPLNYVGVAEMPVRPAVNGSNVLDYRALYTSYSTVLSYDVQPETTYYVVVNGNANISAVSCMYCPKLQSTWPQNNTFVESCPEKLMLVFDTEINLGMIERADLAVKGQGSIQVSTGNMSVIDGNTLVIATEDLASLPSGSEVYCAIKFNHFDKPVELAFTVQEALAVAASDVAEGWITFNQKIAFVDEVENFFVDIKQGEEVVGKARLSLDEEDTQFKAVNVEMPQGLQAGDYKLVIPASTILSTITEEMNNEIEIDFAYDGTIALQSTNPMNHGFVEAVPAKLMLMFNQEITVADVQIATIAVQGQGELDVEAENMEVIDGNTLVITAEELTALPSGSVVTCNVKLARVWAPFELYFTVQEALAVAASDVAEGWITFNQKIAFADDAENAFASILRGEAAIGKALLTYDEEDTEFKALVVEMPQGLEAGDYKLYIAPSTIKSTITEEMNSDILIEFTSEGTPSLQTAYPMNNSFVEAAPAKMIFMFDTEISIDDIQIATIAVQGQGELDVDAENMEVIDGNTLVITDEELTSLPSGSVVSCNVKLYGVWAPYELSFTVQAALAVEASDVAEGWITFNQKIAFVEEVQMVMCELYQGGNKLDEYATLEYDEEDETFRSLTITLPENLAEGTYRLVIEASTIMSTVTEEMNDEIVLVFTVKGSTTALDSISTAAQSNGKYLINGKVVIVKAGAQYDINGIRK